MLQIWFPTFLLICFGHQEVRAQYENWGRPFVSGGFNQTSREVPWHVGIYSKTTKAYRQICGGTLIAKHAVLTAAHCFSADRNIPPASNFAVAAGKSYRQWNDTDASAQRSDVLEIHIPPRYQGSVANFQDDIALAILEKPFTINELVEPACLDFNPLFDGVELREGQLGKVAGWGLTSANGRPSEMLQAAILPSIPIQKCIEQSPPSFRSSITGDKICAGYSNGTAVCRGDSGGGLVFSYIMQNFRRNYLRGIISTSPTSNDKCNVYTWATFTHVIRHEDFIKSIVPDVEENCVERNINNPGESKFMSSPNNKTCLCPCQ